MDGLIVRKRRKAPAPDEAGGAWKIALADFMCALMITFFALWAINQQDPEKVKVIADYFKGIEATEEETVTMIDTLFEEIEKILEEQAIVVTMNKNARGIVIKFDSSSLFESGSADLKENAKKAFNILADKTKHTGLFYHMYGYTDNVPVRQGSALNSNLLLSVARASKAAQAMIDGGVTSDMLTIHGEGLLNPDKKGDDKDSRAANRRVELYMSYASAPHKIYGDNVTFTNLDKAKEEHRKKKAEDKLKEGDAETAPPVTSDSQKNENTLGL